LGTLQEATKSVLEQRSPSPKVKRVYNRKKRRTNTIDPITTDPVIEKPSSSTTIKKGFGKSSQKEKQKILEEKVSRRPHTRITNKLRLNEKSFANPTLKNTFLTIEDDSEGSLPENEEGKTESVSPKPIPLS
jgi:hypothetical protein